MNKRLLRSALATVIFSAVACGGFVAAVTPGVAETAQTVHADGGPPDSGWHAEPADSGWRSAAPAAAGSDSLADKAAGPLLGEVAA
jgi:hypothetical protein